MTQKIKITLAFLLLSRIGFTQITFEGYTTDTLIPYQITNCADLDNNGTDDLVIGTIKSIVLDLFPPSTERNIEIFLQSEEGNFILQQIIRYDSLDGTSGDIETIEIVDMNNDNLKDLILGYYNKVAIYYQDNLHNFKKDYEHQIRSGVKSVSIADINNDSLNDILVAGEIFHEIDILYQNDTSGFDAVSVEPDSPGGIYEPEMVDLNHDGRIDIVYIGNHQWDAPFYVLLNDSINGITNSSIGILTEFAEIDWTSFEIGYVNSDRLIDIVATTGGNNNGEIYIFYLEDSKNLIFRHETISTSDIPAAIKIIDLNYDGINDIVVNHDLFLTISIYEQSKIEGFSDVVELWNYFGNMNDYGWTFGKFNNDSLIDIFIPAAGSYLFYFNITDLTSNVINSYSLVNSEVNIYPNPAVNYLNISQSYFENCELIIKFYDIQGVFMKEVKVNSDINTINISDLKSGIYYYKIWDKNNLIKNGKILKK